jgi:tetratricopeptide (TPR) repeat protein
MVKTLLQYETTHKTRIHKGLAYNNLGVTLYKLGRLEEAKEAFKKAYEEDVKSYGEAAKDSLAKKALDSMSTEKKA